MNFIFLIFLALDIEELYKVPASAMYIIFGAFLTTDCYLVISCEI